MKLPLIGFLLALFFNVQHLQQPVAAFSSLMLTPSSTLSSSFPRAFVRTTDSKPGACNTRQFDAHEYEFEQESINRRRHALLQRHRIFSLLGSIKNGDAVVVKDTTSENTTEDSSAISSKDEVDNSSNTIEPPITMSDRIIQAAADLTTSTSSLLGTKSVGVDYGLVRTGIAVSNGYNPQPLFIESKLNNTELSTKIIKLVETEGADQIVVGLPFHKNGTEAEQTIITRDFASKLNCAVCAHFGFDAVPIFLWDERYTSKEAESRIRAVNPRAGKLYKELDADAASIILEYYYGDNGLGAERVQLPDSDDIRNAIEQAWLLRKEERRREMQALRDQRMNAGNVKQQLMEKARLLDEKLAKSGSVNKKKAKKKKKKKKRTWINLTSNMTLAEEKNNLNNQ